MSHTKCPLTTKPVRGTSLTEIRNADGYWVANVRWKETASRIVACVNACEGLPTEDLERWGWSLITKLREDEANSFIKQRDELLAALEFAREKIAELHVEAGDGDCHYPMIDDAVSGAKGSVA